MLDEWARGEVLGQKLSLRKDEREREDILVLTPRSPMSWEPPYTVVRTRAQAHTDILEPLGDHCRVLPVALEGEKPGSLQLRLSF